MTLYISASVEMLTPCSQGFGFVLDDAADELGDVEGALVHLQQPKCLTLSKSLCTIKADAGLRAVFVHYTTISSVKGGPNGFKSLLEVRRL